MPLPFILLVDEDPLTRQMYGDVLREEGYRVDTAGSGEEAISMIDTGGYDVVVTDIFPSEAGNEGDGLEFVRKIKNRHPVQEIVILTGHATTSAAISALRAGVSDFLRKPVNPEEFRITIKRILEKSRLFKDNDRLQETIKVLEVCNRISSCLDLEDLSQMALDVMLGMFNASVGALVTFDDSKECFSPKYTRNMAGSMESNVISYLNSLHARKRTALETVNLFHPLSNFPAAGGGSPFRSMLYLPVITYGRLFGACAVFHLKEERPPSKNQIKNLEVISRQINLAFENALKLRQARELAYIDELTGCYNTRYLDEFVEKEIKRAKRHGYPLSFLFLDLDHFKKVNDTHGHLVGSRVLIDVARLIRQATREIDIVVRYGGDEFVILLVNTSADGAMEVAERIRKMIAAHTFGADSGLSLRLSASIGIATYPEHARDKRAVLDLADRAMYHVKSTTRNSVYIASSSELMSMPIKPH